ncbi:hypothetical protein GCM10011369_27220 [Neiella marina]|uniref:eCIS core domain-containing protein n=1 Tax=Neiella marina TaxID=508461 RepID=A0A8J2U7H7_9GAMM|nr:DUF4157 domain-containing protein [Neiella marina]GGA83762.1 hypothetical protein GCM10011369_27220 [Neiella marina]
MDSAKVARSATRAPLQQNPRLLRAAADQAGLKSKPVAVALKSIQLSKPQDADEQEADQTADKVMRMAQSSQQVPARPATIDSSPARGTISQSSLLQRQASPLNGQSSNSLAPEQQQHISAELASANHGGQPLPNKVRQFMEPRFGVDFSAIRIHTDGAANRLNKQLSARAFAWRNHVFFAENQFQPESEQGKRLIAHELTHSIQQGATSKLPNSNKPPMAVVQQRSDSIQRLGVSDAINYFASKAYHIPGFRMLTLLVGFNPITMTRTSSNAPTRLKAVLEMAPGGHLLTQVLESHGLINKVAIWLSARLTALGLSAQRMRSQLLAFLDRLSWRDIFNLSGVWLQAKRMFAEPVFRVVNYVGSLITTIQQTIKQTLLAPLAKFAAKTRGWDLLCAVLGKNPITSAKVTRNAETVLGGFMTLIGQQQVWQNIKKANAIGRAWQWFQTTLVGLKRFVSAIPRIIQAAIGALKLADLLTVFGAFKRIGQAFVGFVGHFVGWARNQVYQLLLIIFSVVAPKLMPYLKRAGKALRFIIRHPLHFFKNLARAAKRGLQRFAGNIVRHLRGALLGWLTGTLSGAGIALPKSFSLKEITKFVLSVLGVTWQAIRRKLVAAIGEPKVALLERGVAWARAIVTQGPIALWQKLKQGVVNLKQRVLGQIIHFIKVRIVQAAIVRLLSMINPAGAFVQAILAIYNTIMFFVQRLRGIIQVAKSLLSSMFAIASGHIKPAARKVEQSLAKSLTLVISFLARLLGLGNISKSIGAIITKLRAPVDRMMDKAVRWLVNKAKSLGATLSQTKVLQTKLPKDPAAKLRMGLAAAKRLITRLPRGRLGEAVINKALMAIKLRFGFKQLEPRVRNNRWWVYGRINPEGEQDTQVPTANAPASQAVNALPDQIDILDSSNTVQIANYSRSRKSGDMRQSIYSGNSITLSKARFKQNGKQQIQNLGRQQQIRYTISEVNEDYKPPLRIKGIVDSANPEEAATYNGHRRAFGRHKRDWWRGVNSEDGKIQGLIIKGWLLPGTKKGLQGGTRKWRFIYSLFNDDEKRHYGRQAKRKANMLRAFENHPDKYRVNDLYEAWDSRIGEQTEIHHMLPLDFGANNDQTFIPLSREMHTKSGNSIHLAFWNPLKRWLVGLRGSAQRAA